MGHDGSSRRIDRRQFLRTSGTVGAIAAFPGLLTACGSDSAEGAAETR